MRVLLIAFATLWCSGCTQTTNVAGLKAYYLRHQFQTIVFQYLGSANGYHYFNLTFREFRVPESELKLKNTFPLTKDPAKWRYVQLSELEEGRKDEG